MYIREYEASYEASYITSYEASYITRVKKKKKPEEMAQMDPARVRVVRAQSYPLVIPLGI